MNNMIDDMSIYIKREISKNTEDYLRVVPAEFVAAETVDANLSHIKIHGAHTARFVKKLASVGTPSFGDQLLCVKVGDSLTIIGVIVGKTSLADAGV